MEQETERTLDSAGQPIMQRILVAATIVLIYVGICRFVAVPEGLAKLVQDPRQSANEAGAMSLIKTIARCQIVHLVSKGKGKFADLRTLCEENEDLRESLGSKDSPGQKYGYLFTSTPVDYPDAPAMFDTTAVPLDIEKPGSGKRSFGSNETNVLYEAEGAVVLKGTAEDRHPKGGKAIQ
jgi:hypothetical protein